MQTEDKVRKAIAEYRKAQQDLTAAQAAVPTAEQAFKQAFAHLATAMHAAYGSGAEVRMKGVLCTLGRHDELTSKPSKLRVLTD